MMPGPDAHLEMRRRARITMKLEEEPRGFPPPRVGMGEMPAKPHPRCDEFASCAVAPPMAKVLFVVGLDR
jgi:hypothetical protein